MSHLPTAPHRTPPGALIALLAGLLLALATPAAAQGNTEILTGHVTGPAGEPLAYAQVAATVLDSGVRRATLADARGRYVLIFPGGGGRYQLEVSRLGLQTETIEVELGADEQVRYLDVQLAVAPITLEGIVARAEAPRRPARAARRTLPGEWLQLMPIDPSDLAALASLAPAVVGLEATDSIGSGGFSVAGQRPDLNRVTLDGATFGSPRGAPGGGTGIPAEAVRLTRVITNSYDVSRGQFSGGQISTTTRGGTNRLQGTLTYALQEPRLQWEMEPTPFDRVYTQHRLSGGVGGPIVRDRAFYFASAALNHRAQGLQSLIEADAAALALLGAHPDSVARFLEILQGHGLSPRAPVAPSRQLTEELSLFGRFDLTLSPRHSLMLRGDARWHAREGTQVSSLGLPHSGGARRASGGGVMVALTSRFGEELVNELRAYLSRTDSDAEPYLPVPEGRVRVASEDDDGSRSVVTLVFGGNRSLPVTGTERALEMSNELSRPLGARHRLRLGALLSVTRSAEEFSPRKHGSFSFASLEEFAANRANSYSRSLTRETREGGGLNAALYLGDTWQAARQLQLTYGLRGEASHFGRHPDYNPRVDSLFARRTDRFASELHLSPRLGFTYTAGEARSPRATVRGGIGVFRGRPPFSLFSTALGATGLPGGQEQVECVGEVVPEPAWDAYLAAPTLIPAACTDGTAAPIPTGRAPNVTLFAPEFGAPRSWRASLAVERTVSSRLSLSLEGTYNLGVSLYGVIDRNLDATPRFTVPLEEDRPVFVALEEVVPGSGRIGLMDSRLHPEFGQVLEVHSRLRSQALQLTANLRGEPLPGLSLRASYTASRVRDHSSFSCCSAQQGFGAATTAGNPNLDEWGRSDFERRHTLSLTAGLPLRPWAELTLLGRATSGAPFTPLVGGDINGDGARNDRAFVFDPAAAPDSALAAGMARLLTDAPARIRGCLERQLGRIARRNSCHGPWQASLELRTNLRPQLPLLERRVTASIASQNLLVGVDHLLHGAGSLRGWGQRSTPDATLLYPRAFDPMTRSFHYELNERFGDPRRGAIPFVSPFQLHLEARVAVGPQGRGG